MCTMSSPSIPQGRRRLDEEALHHLKPNSPEGAPRALNCWLSEAPGHWKMFPLPGRVSEHESPPTSPSEVPTHLALSRFHRVASPAFLMLSSDSLASTFQSPDIVPLRLISSPHWAFTALEMKSFFDCQGARRFPQLFAEALQLGATRVTSRV